MGAPFFHRYVDHKQYGKQDGREIVKAVYRCHSGAEYRKSRYRKSCRKYYQQSRRGSAYPVEYARNSLAEAADRTPDTKEHTLYAAAVVVKRCIRVLAQRYVPAEEYQYRPYRSRERELHGCEQVG